MITQAFQTWAAQANISIGLTTDSGDPFGVAGLMQGDPRFGDIRIGAVPLAADVMAITVPPDPFMSGTLAGDMILNSAADLDPADLFDVALHEAGHSLGLPDINDPDSVMDPVLNPDATLTPTDVQNIQALYGTPAPDPYQSNDTFATAAQMPQPPVYLGTTPLVAYGDRSSLSNTDMFWVSPPVLYAGPVTIQLQTSGISFMEPRLQIYNQNFQLVGQAQSTSLFGDTVSVELPRVNPFGRYYIEVDSPAQNVFGTGRYALSVTYDARSIVNPASLPAISRSLRQSSAFDIAGLFNDVTGVLFQADQLLNKTFLTADPLQSEPGYPVDTRYQAVSSLSRSKRCKLLSAHGPPALCRAGRDLDREPGRDARQWGVTDRLGLQRQHQTCRRRNPAQRERQLRGPDRRLTPGATYYLAVSPAPASAPAAGNYSLVANFGNVPADTNSFAGGTLSNSDIADQYALYIAQTQLFQFVLSSQRECD